MSRVNIVVGEGGSAAATPGMCFTLTGRLCFGIPAFTIMDSVFSYKTQKLVRVQNYRIGLLYRGLQVAVVALFATQLAYYHSYLEYRTPTAAVSGRLDAPIGWSTRPSDSAAYCAADGSTDYIFAPCNSAGIPDPARTRTYTNNSCSQFEVAQVQHQGHTRFFIATHVQERLWNGSGSVSSQSGHFVPHVEELVLTLEHAYNSHASEGYNSPAQTHRNIQASVVDHTGAVVKKFTAGQPLSLSLGDWLRHAGVALDSQNAAATGGCDISPARATYRLTGSDLNVELDYSRDKPSFHKLGKFCLLT